MGEPNNAAQGGEGQLKEGATDLSKYVSKEDHDKILTSNKDLNTSVEKLKKDVDDASLKLLDPEYIQWREDKKSGKLQRAAREVLDDPNLDNLTPKQILEKATEAAKEAVSQEHGNEVRSLKATISDILAYIEVQVCEKKYEDFGEYREDMKKLIESSENHISIEQAYLISKAKGVKTPAVDGEPAPVVKSGEKPSGSIPAATVETTDFKDSASAAEDAWDKIVGKGKETL